MNNLIKIRILNKDQIFNYTGEILEDKDGFIKIKDIKSGSILSLNKSMIISMEEVSE